MERAKGGTGDWGRRELGDGKCRSATVNCESERQSGTAAEWQGRFTTSHLRT